MIGTFEDKNLCHGDKAYDFTPYWPLASDERTWLGQLRIVDIIENYGNDHWYPEIVVDDNLNLFYDPSEMCSGGPLELMAAYEGLGNLRELCNPDSLLAALPEILEAVKRNGQGKRPEYYEKPEPIFQREGESKAKFVIRQTEAKYEQNTLAYQRSLEAKEKALRSPKQIVSLPDDEISILRGMQLIKSSVETNQLFVYRGTWQPITETEVGTFLDAITGGDSKKIKKAITAIKQDSRNSLSLGRLYPDIETAKRDYFLVDSTGKTLDLLKAVSVESYDVEPEFRPDLYLTNRIAARYDPRTSTAAVEEFLQGSCANPEEDIPVIQEFMGYTLLARQVPVPGALFICGDGRGGRSTFFNALTTMLGRWNVAQISINRMGERFGLDGLKGKMANLIPDMGSYPLQNIEAFKNITGGDYVTVEPKGRQDETSLFLPAKVGIGCNSLPFLPLKYRGEAMYARLMILEFPFYFFGEKKDAPDPDKWRRRDPEMPDKLVANHASGLLKFAVQGLGRLLERKEFSYKYFGPANELRYERLSEPENEVERFIRECCNVEQPRVRIAQWEDHNRAYNAYKKWSTDNGNVPVSTTLFTQGLGKKGFRRDAGSNSYKGFALKPEYV